jgi:hypothetical protein
MADNKSICVTLTIPRELHATLTEWARADDRPLAGIIRRILQREAQRREQEQKSISH